VVEERDKMKKLLALIAGLPADNKTLIFASKKGTCETVSNELWGQGAKSSLLLSPPLSSSLAPPLPPPLPPPLTSPHLLSSSYPTSPPSHLTSPLSPHFTTKV
jgi:hypothetical protein